MSEKSFINEQWKPVKFDGIHNIEQYEVSNYGRIRNFKPDLNAWKILKTATIRNYQYFSFKSNTSWKKRHTKSVHVLVAERFCHRPTPQHKNVIHKDFNKSNNHSGNLMWVTNHDMLEHSRRSPRYQIAIENRRGESASSKLTETQVIRLKKKLLRGKNPISKIAKEFGITHTQVNRIRRGENWGHVVI